MDDLIKVVQDRPTATKLFHLSTQNLELKTALMFNPFASQHLEKGHEQNFDIQQKRTMHQIIFIKFYLYRNRKLIPTINLSPAGKPRSKEVDTFFGS